MWGVLFKWKMSFSDQLQLNFSSDLLCPSDWKLHYLSISARDIRYSASRNADLLKWVLLLPVPSLDLEMGEHTAMLAVGRACTRESPAGFWGMVVGCFGTQLRCSSWRSSFDAKGVEPECSDACSFNRDIKGCFPQRSLFYWWNMTLQITWLWCLEPFSHVWERVPGCVLQGCVLLCPEGCASCPSSGTRVSIPLLWGTLMLN